MNIYKILEGFSFKIEPEEEWKRQWTLYGSPNDTYKIIKSQKDRLDKEQAKMVSKMLTE